MGEKLNSPMIISVQDTKNGMTTTTFDVSEYLDSPEQIAEYFNTAIQSGSPELLYKVIGDIAKAKGMNSPARDIGLGRESLYQSLSAAGSPKFSTISKIANNFGLEIDFKPKAQHA